MSSDSTKPLSEQMLVYYQRCSMAFTLQQFHKNCSLTSSVTSVNLKLYPVLTLRPRQNGRHFLADISKCIFLNKNLWISIKISLKFVPRGPISNIPALVQTMAWHRPGNKLLSEPVRDSLSYWCTYASLDLNKLKLLPHLPGQMS